MSISDQLQEVNAKLVPGFKIMIDKTPPKWIGSIYLKSDYKEEAHYFTSTQESLLTVIEEAHARYRHRVIEGISIKMVKENA